EGWRESRGSELRYATLLLGPKDSPLELSVTPLGQEAGSLLANVNRWRGQMGLPEVKAAELDKLTREIKVDGEAVTVVDMKAEGAGAEERAPEGAADGGEPTYKVPQGWEKSDRQVPFSIATFQAGEGDRRAEVTISPLQ